MDEQDLIRAHRWNAKAMELVRRIHAAGYDPDEELTRLQDRYAKRRDTARLRLPEALPNQQDPRRERE